MITADPTPPLTASIAVPSFGIIPPVAVPSSVSFCASFAVRSGISCMSPSRTPATSVSSSSDAAATPYHRVDDDDALEDADGGAAADGPLLTAERLRSNLIASLGKEAFENAHARLMAAAQAEDGEEDEALAGGGARELLGLRYLETLPLLLKLIFLECKER